MPARIARIRVRTSRNIYDTLRNHAPTDELSGKFSMEFCIAVMLHEGKCGLNEFNRGLAAHEDIRRTMALVDYAPFDAQAATGDYRLNTTLIEFELTNGDTIAKRVDWGKGSKADPMSMDEVADKFRECARYARWPTEKAEQAILLVRRLETVSSVTGLTACLAS